MHIHCEGFELRAWRDGDQASLVRHGNDRQIWRNLRDRFPHPYTAADADAWVALASARAPITNLAIVVNGEAAGGIGFTLHTDVERCSAEIGYWLGRRHWGRGIMTAAVRAATHWALEEFSLTRVFAVPFVHNVASFRVLEKSSYRREGVLRRSAIKDGRVVDRVLYAITDQDLAPGPGSRMYAARAGVT